MTQKRFTITQDFEEHHRQIRDNGHIIMGCFLEAQAEPIVKLLNELHEENEEIGNTLDNMVTFKNKYRDRYRKLKEENEQLKSYTGEMEDYLARLEEKNEQLKSQLRNLRKLANELYMEKKE